MVRRTANGDDGRVGAPTQPEFRAQIGSAPRVAASDAPHSGRYRTSFEEVEPGVVAREAGNRCKGFVFDTVLALMKESFGDGVVRNIRAALPAEVRDAIEGGTLASGGWYPLDWYDALHVAARKVTGRGPDLPREIGRETTRQDLTTGVHRVFLKILWPDLVMQKAPLIFGRYFEQGSMTVGALPAPFDTGGRKVVDASWAGCRGFTENIWQDVLGGCEGGLLAVGARDVIVNVISGGTSGSLDCAATASYR